MPRWQKGQSGNPNGGPTKGRALSTMLKEVGKTLISRPTGSMHGEPQTADDLRVTRKKLLSELLWDAALHGEVRFANNAEGQQRILKVGIRDWLQIVNMIFDRVDGLPVERVEVTGGGLVVATAEELEQLSKERWAQLAERVDDLVSYEQSAVERGEYKDMIDE